MNLLLARLSFICESFGPGVLANASPDLTLMINFLQFLDLKKNNTWASAIFKKLKILKSKLTVRLNRRHMPISPRS